MGLDSAGLFSDTVCVMAVEAVYAVSYRTVAATIHDMMGLTLSRKDGKDVWRMVYGVPTSEHVG